MGSLPAITPLDASEIDLIEASESTAERFWRCIPILGWMISLGLWTKRNRPIRERLIAQLSAREAAALEEWGEDRDYAEFAEAICRIAQEAMGWPSAAFVPDDPWRVVFWSYEDGLDAQAAMMDIEIAFDLDIPDELIERHVDGTLGGFVRELYESRDSLRRTGR